MVHMIKPMLLHGAETGFVLNDDWLLELKYDGVRAVVDTRGDDPKIYTRKGVDITFQFPEIRPPGGLLLDGEIVGFDGSFHKLNWVQRRMGVGSATKVAARIEEFPIEYVAFDLLNDLTLNLEQRLTGLTLIRKQGHTQISPTWPAASIDALWGYVRINNLEGLVAKRRTSKYVPGTRTYNWLKIKHTKPRYQ
jgi:bifunctional non-homologous end joining protein LigD